MNGLATLDAKTLRYLSELLIENEPVDSAMHERLIEATRISLEAAESIEKMLGEYKQPPRT